MPFPKVVTSATSTSGVTSSVNSVVTLPSGIVAGDLLLVFIGKDSAALNPFTWPGGWTPILDSSTTGVIVGIGWAKAAGGETSITVTTTVAERSNMIALRIDGGTWDGVTAPVQLGGTAGSSTTPNPTGGTPTAWSQNDTLYGAVVFADDSASPFPITAWPTNYNDNRIQCSHAAAGVASACAVAVCTRELFYVTGVSEDPGAFTMTVTETWIAYTFAVRGARVPQREQVYPQLLAQ